MRPPRPLLSGVSRCVTAVLAAAVAVPATAVTADGSARQGDLARAPRDGIGIATADRQREPHPVRSHVQSLKVPAVPPAARHTASASEPARSALADDSHVGVGDLVARLRSPVDGGFSLVGVTWAGTADAPDVTVVARTRATGGWSDWTELTIDSDEGPAASEESGARGGTAPLYVSESDALEVAVYSASGETPADLEVAAVDPGQSTYDASAATLATTASEPAKDGFPGLPAVVSRRQWGADPSLGDRCWDPRFGDTFKAVFVHHTAGSNDYSRAESPAVVRGVYAYHTQSRGWCDIGYNFLVDRYGTIFEGRRGGVRRPVRGAHSGDYNFDSTGISLMGTFEDVMPPRAMRRALVDLVTWRLGTAYHGGRGTTYIEGRRFQRISGHRDAMSTSCPGARVYAWLPTLRDRVAARLDNFMSPIKRKWLALGGRDSQFDTVRIGETIEHGGRHTTFQDGRMYAFDGYVRPFPSSPLLRRYVNSGETGGDLGYPVTRVRSPADGLAAYFEGGAVYWSERTKSKILLNGPVLSRYVSERAAAGPLGFPSSPVYSIDGGSRARFEHGTITYLRSTGRTTVDRS